LKYVSQEEYDSLVKRIEARRTAVSVAKRKQASATTLEEKIAASRDVRRAMSINVLNGDNDK